MCLNLSLQLAVTIIFFDPLKLPCRRQKFFAVCIPQSEKVVAWVECVFFLQIDYNVH